MLAKYVFLLLHWLLAHVLADFPLQFDWLFAWKRKSPWGTLVHTLVFTGCMIVLSLPYLGQGLMWWYIIFLSATHFVMDTIKPWLPEEFNLNNLQAFIIDQLFHIFWIAWLAYWGAKALLHPEKVGGLWIVYNSNILMVSLIVAVLFLYRGIFHQQIQKDSPPEGQ